MNQTNKVLPFSWAIKANRQPEMPVGYGTDESDNPIYNPQTQMVDWVTRGNSWCSRKGSTGMPWPIGSPDDDTKQDD